MLTAARSHAGLTHNEQYRRALELCERLPFHRPWSLDTFVAAVGVLVGTPITVGDLPEALIAEGLTGLWIPAPLMHSIFVPPEADGEYREHLVAHELAHIAMTYFATEGERREMRREVFARLAPQLPLSVIDHRDPPPMLCYARSEMMHPLEQRAEWLATLILCRASDIREPLYPASLPAPQRALLDRFAKMYGADRA